MNEVLDILEELINDAKEYDWDERELLEELANRLLNFHHVKLRNDGYFYEKLKRLKQKELFDKKSLNVVDIEDYVEALQLIMDLWDQIEELRDKCRE